MWVGKDGRHYTSHRGKEVPTYELEHLARDYGYAIGVMALVMWWCL